MNYPGQKSNKKPELFEAVIVFYYQSIKSNFFGLLSSK